jgi:hypothetical protein
MSDKSLLREETGTAFITAGIEDKSPRAIYAGVAILLDEYQKELSPLKKLLILKRLDFAIAPFAQSYGIDQTVLWDRIENLDKHIFATESFKKAKTPSELKQYFDEAISYYDQDPILYCEFAKYLLKFNLAIEAVTLLEPLLNTILKDDPIAHTTYTNALIQSGNAYQAVTHLEPLIQKGFLKNDPIAHKTYANALIQSGNTHQAVTRLEPLIQKRFFKNDPIAHTIYANALVNDGKYSKAQHHLEPLLKQGGILYRNIYASGIYAQSMIRQHDFIKAERFLNSCFVENIDNQHLRNIASIVTICTRKGDVTEESLIHLRKAVQGKNFNPYTIALLMIHDTNKQFVEQIIQPLDDQQYQKVIATFSHLSVLTSYEQAESLLKEEQGKFYGRDLFRSDHIPLAVSRESAKAATYHPPIWEVS